MPDCPSRRILKLLKKFEQAGQVAIPIDDWLYFFEAFIFLNRAAGHEEIHCAIGARYVFFSKTPIEWKVKKEPVQNELFE